jgi:hypothetical protein
MGEGARGIHISVPGLYLLAVASRTGAYHFFPAKVFVEASIQESRWVQTNPGKGWNTILPLYGPLQR